MFRIIGYRFVFFGCLSLCVSGLWSQTVKVIDEATSDGIEEVLLFDERMTGSAVTDRNGYADVTELNGSGIIYLQHPGYHSHQVMRSKGDSMQVIRLASRSIELKEVVVSVSNQLERMGSIPRKVSVIRGRQRDLLQPQTTADMVGQSEKVFIQKSQLGGGSPMIRGLSANRILLVYDHIRINNAISRGGNLQNIISVDPYSLDRIEVIYGPGSMVYGSDALGGVIHMQSIPVIFSDEEGTHGHAGLNYSSASNERTFFTRLGSSTKKWGWNASIAFSNYDDLRMGSHGRHEYLRNRYVTSSVGVDSVTTNDDPKRQRSSGYERFNMQLKTAFKLSPKTRLETFGQFSTTSDVPRYDRLIQPGEQHEFRFAQWHYGPQQWILAGIKLQARPKGKLADQYTVIPYYQNWQESRHSRRFGQEFEMNQLERLNIYGINADLRKHFGERTTLSYGLESVYNQVSSTADSVSILTGDVLAAPTRYPDGGSTQWMSGVYTDLRYRPSKNFVWSAGVRYTYQQLKSVFNDRTFFPFPYNEIALNAQALNGSIGQSARLTKGFWLKANLTSGFRSPNVDDLSKVFDSEPGRVVVPNDQLKPEYLYSGELGIEYSDSSVFRIGIEGFYSYLENAIIRDDFTFNGQDSINYLGEMSQVQALVNKQFARIAGFHLGVEVSPFKRWIVKADYTITRGEDNEGNALRHVSPDFGAVHLIYRRNRLETDFFIRVNDAMAYDRLSPSERNKAYLYAADDNGLPYSPQWSTWNFFVKWNPLDWMSVKAGVENLTDLRYRPYSSGIAAPGRNFVFGMKTTF